MEKCEPETRVFERRKSFVGRRDVIAGAAALMTGLVVAGAPSFAQVASQTRGENGVDHEDLSKRLQRLEEQNERIIGLLEKIAAASPAYKGKALPAEEPDFAKIKRELQSVMAKPEIAAVLELGEFKTKTWICEAVLLHKVKDMKPYWSKIEEVVNTVSAQCKVPGRAAGWYADPHDPQRFIGTTVQFGYSREVGYDYENELYKDLKK
jgi:hypothetical protein